MSATRNSNVRPLRLRGSFWRIGWWTIFSTIFSTMTCVGGRRSRAASAPVLVGGLLLGRG
jgi:hypothetical protein